MPNKDTLIVIPAKNEADSILAVLNDIKTHFATEATVLLVNDNSTDNTAELAEQAGVEVVNLTVSLGAWGAMQTGLRYAQRKNYQHVITMDADGQHQANTLATLYAPLKNKHCDVVIGAYPERGSLSRRIAWHLFRSLSGVSQSDLTSGFRAYNRLAINLLASKRATLLDYQDMGVLLLLHDAGLHIHETAIPMRKRQIGQSRIFNSWWAVSHYMIYTVVLCFARRSRWSFFSNNK